MASEIKSDKLSPSTGTSLQIGDASDTITIPTGATFTVTDGIGVSGGGTGLTSFTAGDVLYATGTTTLAKLAKGTAEQVLAMNSGATAPDWGSVDLTVLPTITVAKGGTNIASFTAGDILYATGTTTLAKLAKGTTLQHLRMNAGATAPEWTAAPSSGGLVKIGTGTFSSASTVDLGQTLGSYRVHKLFFYTRSIVQGQQIYLQLTTAAGVITTATYVSSLHDSTSAAAHLQSGFALGVASSMRLTNDGVDDGYYSYFDITLANLTRTGTYDLKSVWCNTYGPNHDAGPVMHGTYAAGFNTDSNTTAVTDVRFLPTSSTLEGGWELYGLAN